MNLLGEVGSILGSQPGAQGDSLRSALDSVAQAARSSRPPSALVPRLRRLHTGIASEFGVQITPQTVPSLPVGRLVYESSCVLCHGEDGRAATPAAMNLTPRPRNLLAPEQAGRLSPYSAFAAVTWGIQGTAMPSFELLPEDEGWSVAFYILALRQDPGEPAAEVPVAGAPQLVLPLEISN